MVLQPVASLIVSGTTLWTPIHDVGIRRKV
jgi:hypothetical protein